MKAMALTFPRPRIVATLSASGGGQQQVAAPGEALVAGDASAATGCWCSQGSLMMIAIRRDHTRVVEEWVANSSKQGIGELCT